MRHVDSATVDEVCFDLLCPRAAAQEAIGFWMQNEVVLCEEESPRRYRRVRFFGEKGLEMRSAQDDRGVLEEMRQYERFVVDILNVCTDFDVAKLQRRLTVFLQGVNRCRRGRRVECRRPQRGGLACSAKRHGEARRGV